MSKLRPREVKSMMTWLEMVLNLKLRLSLIYFNILHRLLLYQLSRFLYQNHLRVLLSMKIPEPPNSFSYLHCGEKARNLHSTALPGTLQIHNPDVSCSHRLIRDSETLYLLYIILTNPVIFISMYIIFLFSKQNFCKQI